MRIIKEGYASKYQFLGIEEGEWTCEFCHKKHIFKMFTVRDTDTGDIMRFGSQCIKIALGLTSTDITREKRKMFKVVQERQNKEGWEFEMMVKEKKREYEVSGKDEKIPWQYSPENKEFIQQRLEMDRRHLDELKNYR